MKIATTYTLVFVVIVATIITTISLSQSPEKKIVGQWNELSWEYERVDMVNDTNNKEITDDVKKIIGQHLLIHEAETWKFLSNGKLVLKAGENERLVDWKIKGRGHILQLKYDNDVVENYNLTELNNNVMVLNFDSEIQARGIAKLTFEKS
ncbi:hypothetical protein [Flavobacterium orientale]|jgi:hypothetical protein|uniref:Lipocalin-like domain-containing protein n=1 Tax=Flavobacterium orientale TaxID=1756020 RepID=A0A916Y6G0_9FLAO|nr:hypothetical protein [Flavobacterium orientale]GGD32406.1 hypothetical protein GCM10011343_23110 [Flavobacterium orientale]